MKFYIHTLIFFLITQFSCDYNISNQKIFVESNILNGQLKNNDTLILQLNSDENLTFKIKTNMELISIVPVKKDISESHVTCVKTLGAGRQAKNHKNQSLRKFIKNGSG